MRLREHEDGTLTAPKRGTPPKPPEGYEPSPGDPYTFFPKLPDCDRRETFEDKIGCCGGGMRTRCTELKMLTDRLMCSQCGGDPLNIVELVKERRTLYIEGHHGWGDNIYQYPLIASLKDYTIYLRTTWPELYWDLPHVKFVHPETNYRTQKKHVAQYGNWSRVPNGVRRIAVQYDHTNDTSISQTFADQLGIEFEPCEVPINPSWDVAAEKLIRGWNTKKPIAMIHMPTLRREWMNPSRNCKPEYIQQLIDEISKTHFIVSVANIKAGIEWFEKAPTHVDKKYHSGEISMSTQLALAHKIDLIISPVGYMLPLGLTTGCKTIIVFGGCVKPELLVDVKFDCKNLHMVVPHNFCNCLSRVHDCNKEIDEDILFGSLAWNLSSTIN